MTSPTVLIRPMRADDLTDVDRVYRLAFGTQFGLPDPSQFRGDSQVIRVRWATDQRPCFVAEAGGRIVGSIIGMDWGSVFVLGPLTVDPAYAGRGIGRQLIEPMINFIATHGFSLAALFTFPHSPKHIHLYESYGFVPQHLTPVLSMTTTASVIVPAKMRTQSDDAALALDSRLRGNDGKSGAVRLFSEISPSDRAATLAACRAISGTVFPGLDLTREIEAIPSQGIGETVLLNPGAVAGFALCHIGAGSEAGSGTLFVKFACVRPLDDDGFGRLIDACECLAALRGASRIVAGVNRGRDGAYQLLRARGFRADLIGVAMHWPDGLGYNRPEVYAIDDWR